MKKNPYRALWFRCTGCGNCCKDGIPIVAEYDIRRIMKATGLPADKIAAFFAYDDLDFPKDAPDWIKTENGDRIMGLKRKRGQCVFLKKNRCSIYKARPDTCRLYPYDWELDEDDRICKLKFLKGIECNCAYDATVDLEKLSVIARLETDRFDDYEEKVRAWNRQRKMRKEREFLEFIGVL